jgi:hypothetical protein
MATFVVRFLNLQAFYAHQPVVLPAVYQLPFTVASDVTFGIDALTLVVLLVFGVWSGLVVARE